MTTVACCSRQKIIIIVAMTIPAVFVDLNEHVVISEVLTPFTVWMWIQRLYQHIPAHTQTHTQLQLNYQQQTLSTLLNQYLPSQ